MTNSVEGTVLPIKVVPTTLHIENLSYRFVPDSLNHSSFLRVLRSLIPKHLSEKLLGSSERLEMKSIHNVSFRCLPGQITGIIGDRSSVRKAIVDLLCGHRKYGQFSGEIYMTVDPNIHRTFESVNKYVSNEFEYFNSITLIPRKSLHLCGLSYLEMLEFSVKLKTMLGPTEAKQRALELLEFVGLKDKARYYIPDEFSPRGHVGSDLRKLTIAISMIVDNPIIVLDDPFKNVDTIYANYTLDIMNKLAARGHTIICTTSRVEPFMIDSFRHVVVLQEGRSVYASSRDKLEAHFASSNLQYNIRKNNRMIGEFLLDLSAGNEPAGDGHVVGSKELQEIFESSPHNLMKQEPMEGRKIIAYTDDGHARRWKFSDSKGLYAVCYRSFVMAHRAFLCKLRETAILQKTFAASVILALFVGCLMYGQGDIGSQINTNACIEFEAPNPANPQVTTAFDLGCLYPNLKVLNITGSMFLSISLAITLQVLNVHAVVRKLLVGRYEQRNGYGPPFLFGVVMLISELVPAFFFEIIYTVIYMSLTILGMY